MTQHGATCSSVCKNPPFWTDLATCSPGGLGILKLGAQQAAFEHSEVSVDISQVVETVRAMGIGIKKMRC